ncbi:MAG TPA: hypothetical protein VM674_09135 [Candidatus Acidoferrum sp.]|nr:hypothetical protein [Candidatus Acidoferrum sp.]
MNAAELITKPTRALAVASGLIAATSIVGFAQDVTVGFNTVGNFAMTNSYVNPPTGTATLGGHSFDFTSGNMIRLPGGQSASISGNYPYATSAYVLINSYNTWLNYAGQSIGNIVITFSDGTTQTVSLIVGGNISEWRPAATNTVDSTTDPNAITVWTDQATTAAGGGTAIINMLTIPVATKTITGITINETDLTGTGFLVQGLTIDDGNAPQPICIRSGNSCSTPAAQNSQSWKWQPVQSGATNTNLNTNGNGTTHGNGKAHGHKAQ